MTNPVSSDLANHTPVTNQTAQGTFAGKIGDYFLKMKQEKCNENISPDMQAAIQHQVEEKM